MEIIYIAIVLFSDFTLNQVPCCLVHTHLLARIIRCHYLLLKLPYCNAMKMRRPPICFFQSRHSSLPNKQDHLFELFDPDISPMLIQTNTEFKCFLKATLARFQTALRVDRDRAV